MASTKGLQSSSSISFINLLITEAPLEAIRSCRVSSIQDGSYHNSSRRGLPLQNAQFRRPLLDPEFQPCKLGKPWGCRFPHRSSEVETRHTVNTPFLYLLCTPSQQGASCEAVQPESLYGSKEPHTKSCLVSDPSSSHHSPTHRAR